MVVDPFVNAAGPSELLVCSIGPQLPASYVSYELRMNLRNSARAAIAAVFLTILPAHAQQAPQPQVTIDLKPLGAATDLFADRGDSKYQQRGVINVFWLDNDHFAVAFSTSRRWSGTQKPEPLHIRLIVFDLQGKKLHSRDWDVGAEGPEAVMTVELTPGPDNSILVIHRSNSESKIPDGDFVQVLNSDTTLRQDFHVPATSNWVPSILPEPGMVLQTYYADKHSSLTWWSGNPLKPGVKLDLSPNQGQLLAGPPGVATWADCTTSIFCTGVHVYRQEKPALYYSLPEGELEPLPRVFLSPTSLVIELRSEEKKQSDLVLTHADGTHTPLPVIPHGSQVVGVTGVSRDGQRFALTAAGEVGICGMFDFWCNERSHAIVIDVPTNRIVFQQGVSAAAGTSGLSPDGKHLAIFDRDKLSVYALP